MTPNESKVILAKLEGVENLFKEKFAHNDESHADLREILHRKANKWTELVLRLLMGGTAIWVINQLLDMIPRLRTAYIYLTIS